MGRFRTRAAAAALLSLLALGSAACGRARFLPGTAAPLQVLVFYDGQIGKPTSSMLQMLSANRSAIWELAPLWYAVQPDGSVKSTTQPSVMNFAHTHNIKLMPLVVNGQSTSSFLLNAGTCTSGPCAAAVSNLAAIVQKENYDGLNIDFELLKRAARPGLVAFVNQLHQKLRPMGKTLTVDIIPAGSQRQADGPYNYPALAKDSDEIVLMTYDHHDNTSKPGPIAPMSWVTKCVNEALHLGVSPAHLVLGLADYGYEWPTSGGRGHTVGLNGVDAMIARMHIKVARTADGSPHFTYGGGSHVVWYEDQVSIVPKIKLARQDHLKALALWMAGYETPAYWKALRAAAAGQTPAPSSSAAARSSSASGSTTGPSAASSSGTAGGSSSSASRGSSSSASRGASSSSSGSSRSASSSS